MFGLGHTEILIMLVVAFLLFGHRLPSLLRSLGSSIKEFRKGVDDDD